MLQENGQKLIDTNVGISPMKTSFGGYVFISAMSIQSESANQIIERCKRLNAKIVAGGPLFTSSPEYYQQIDHLVLDEAEITLPLFLRDLSEGKAKQLYTTDEWRILQPLRSPFGILYRLMIILR